MGVAKLHKLCVVARSVRDWCKSLRQREGEAVSGARECAYLKNLLNVSCRKMYDDKFVHLVPDEIDLGKGTPVKIIGSAFDGVIGTLLKSIKAARSVLSSLFKEWQRLWLLNYRRISSSFRITLKNLNYERSAESSNNV